MASTDPRFVFVSVFSGILRSWNKNLEYNVLCLIMDEQNLGDTQPTGLPVRPLTPETLPSQPVQPSAANLGVSGRRYAWLWFPVAVLLLSLGTAIGVQLGFRSGNAGLIQLNTEASILSIQEQYNLGVADLEAGRYDVARQRFEFIYNQNPNYPGLTEKMAAALTILYATATPSPFIPTPTITVTPTADLRPVQARFDQAEIYLSQAEWGAAIDTLVGLRKDEPTYNSVRVDGMLYLALRQRGVSKIFQESNLEGGIYDLSLAENFGPLDLEATVARNMARLYLYGSSFWEAYPEKAVFYFSQVAAAAPYLRDASGWTATERYRSVLIQYGAQLAREGDWCSAVEQFELAASIRSDAAIATQLDAAYLACSPPTSTLAITPTFTPTPSITPTWTGLPPTVAQPTATETLPAPATDTPAPPDTPTPEPPTAPPPTDTPPPTEIPLPSDTPPAPPVP